MWLFIIVDPQTKLSITFHVKVKLVKYPIAATCHLFWPF